MFLFEVYKHSQDLKFLTVFKLRFSVSNKTTPQHNLYNQFF